MYDEHQVVETTMNIFREGFYIQEGTSGVIVSIHNEGEAYTVEFPNEPNNPVITCYANEVEEAINE